MICDNNFHIRFLQAGFFGSTHDAQSFRLMEPIRPGMALDILIDAVFFWLIKGIARSTNINDLQAKPGQSHEK